MDILKQLNALAKKVQNTYPYVNNGGCCIHAAMVAKALQKHGIDAKGIVASHYAGSWRGVDMTIEEARTNLRRNTVYEWDKNGISVCHIGIEFMYEGKLRHYDSNGVHVRRNRLDGLRIYKGRMELKDLAALARSRGGWNTRWDRKNNNGLQELVTSTLSIDNS
jgi:hypothetical protein